MRRKLIAFALLAVAFAAFTYAKRRPVDPTVAELRDLDMHTINVRNTPGDTRLVFIGDSLSQRWIFRPQLLSRFAEYKPAVHGVGGERIEHVLWRVQNGALDGISPDWVVIQCGINNVGPPRPFFQEQDPSPAQIADGLRVLCDEVLRRQPQARVVLMALFPRKGRQEKVDAVNALLPSIEGVTVLNINARLGPGSTVDGLHLTDEGYEVWADELLHLMKP